jgi:acyl-CoA synthetase (AMP-forming)/AMP-acid ligase II
MTGASANIAQHLPAMAARLPATPALKVPRGRGADGRIDYLVLTFAELDGEVDAWVRHLEERGVRRDDRVLLMVKQGLPLIASAFALFKIGAVPVVIDPGMGLKNFLACVRRSRPRVLLGIPLARLMALLFRPTFRTVEVKVGASADPVARLSAAGEGVPAKVPVIRAAADLAAILFTSGSTGAPKGVCYEHGMFAAQVETIRSTYAIAPGEVDLPMLPIFALFNPALGMTTVVPEIDPRRPASVDPRKIVQAIQQEKVTNSFGSPTLWSRIAGHCIQGRITLPTLKRVLCAGAPVPLSLWEQSLQFLPGGQLFSPYGATEALPVSSVSAAEILERHGASSPASEAGSSGAGASGPRAGACVGRVVGDAEVRIIAIEEKPLPALEHAVLLPPGEVGEIIVAGSVVTKNYDGLPEATAAAKIKGEGRVWHRLGDCGCLDGNGVLWFFGRKVERVITSDGVFFTEPCERVFRPLAGVARCALIGFGERPRQVPALVIQPADPSLPSGAKEQLARELRAVAKANPATVGIRKFFFHPDFPVDVRHNAKIHRLTLARWAAGEQAIEID